MPRLARVRQQRPLWQLAVSDTLRPEALAHHQPRPRQLCVVTEHVHVWRSVPRPTRTHKRWPLTQLAELHHARFMLQPCALELFLANCTTALLCFGSSEVRRRLNLTCPEAHCVLLSDLCTTPVLRGGLTLLLAC